MSSAYGCLPPVPHRGYRETPDLIAMSESTPRRIRVVDLRDIRERQRSVLYSRRFIAPVDDNEFWVDPDSRVFQRGLRARNKTYCVSLRLWMASAITTGRRCKDMGL